MRNLSILVFLFFHFLGKAQTIKPFILNMGGGNGSSLSVQSSWSIGESSVIGTFSNSLIQFNAGVLQPNIDVVTSVDNIGTVIYGNQITITPNPSFGKIQIHFKMLEGGRSNMSLFNSSSQLVKVFDADLIGVNQLKTYTLDNLTAGTYFLKVHYESFNGKKQFGVFKIIKL